MAIKEKLIISSGDPAGCGPYISLKAILPINFDKYDIYLVGDKDIFDRFSDFSKLRGKINFVDLATPRIKEVKPGFSTALCGRASLAYLRRALSLMPKENINRLVTAPVSKESIKRIRPDFLGHTEYLADHFKVTDFAMMMASSKIRVAIFTRHLNIRDVPDKIQAKELTKMFSLLASSLRDRFGIKSPKIACSSLNPHASKSTFLETEDETILSAIERFRPKIFGPYPSDSLFTLDSIKKYDCIIAIYHDQAMIPFKLLSMKNGVNVTLGLPVIRTSPAHGPAFDLMSQGKLPFFSSMSESIKLALRLKV